MSKRRIGLVGGRGYVGAELIKLLDQHPSMQLAFASSSSKSGTAIPGTDIDFISLSPDEVKLQTNLDALILALPNDQAKAWVVAIDAAGLDLAVLDISADYRFDENWIYGLPEINAKQLLGAKRIANPGCYATAAQLALYPLRELLDAAPSIFGVSGYSGAGATPNPKNDPENLRDNILAYSLCGHIHEQEIAHHLGREVHFSPHVADFFRGLSLTIHMKFKRKMTVKVLYQTLQGFYDKAPIVQVLTEIPNVQMVANSPMAKIGGVTLNQSGLHGVLVVTLDNLLKGAASQAIQNLELALEL